MIDETFETFAEVIIVVNTKPTKKIISINANNGFFIPKNNIDQSPLSINCVKKK